MKKNFLSLVFIIAAVVTLIGATKLFPASSTVRESHFHEIVAQGDSAICVEYLNGLDRLQSKAVTAAQNSIDNFLEQHDYFVMHVGGKMVDSATLATDLRVLEKALGAKEVASYVVNLSPLSNGVQVGDYLKEVNYNANAFWNWRTMYLLETCSPILRQEIRQVAIKSRWSIWHEYYE